MVGFSATMLEMGNVELTSQGDLTIGRIDNQITPRLQVIREILSTIYLAISQPIFMDLDIPN